MKPETISAVALVMVVALLIWNGSMLRQMLKLARPPRLIVPPDLDVSDMKPGPVIRHENVRTYERGDRVRINHRSGFNPGATGVVEFQEPSGQRCWVTRDGAGSPCYFHNYELDPENP